MELTGGLGTARFRVMRCVDSGTTSYICKIKLGAPSRFAVLTEGVGSGSSSSCVGVTSGSSSPSSSGSSCSVSDSALPCSDSEPGSTPGGAEKVFRGIFPPRVDRGAFPPTVGGCEIDFEAVWCVRAMTVRATKTSVHESLLREFRTPLELPPTPDDDDKHNARHPRCIHGIEPTQHPHRTPSPSLKTSMESSLANWGYEVSAWARCSDASCDDVPPLWSVRSPL